MSYYYGQQPQQGSAAAAAAAAAAAGGGGGYVQQPQMMQQQVQQVPVYQQQPVAYPEQYHAEYNPKSHVSKKGAVYGAIAATAVGAVFLKEAKQKRPYNS